MSTVFFSSKIVGLRVSLDAVGGDHKMWGTVFWLAIEVEAGFVLPLRTPVAHVAHWNTISPY